ncbi:MAG: AfsR/SARP family transcriptional regulator [Acidimicrobiales bacterium]
MGNKVPGGARLWRPDGSHGKLVDLKDGGVEAVIGKTEPAWWDAGIAAMFPVPLAMLLVGVGWLNAPKRDRRQAAAATSAWQALASLAFAPSVDPPRPVLIAPLTALPAPAPTMPAAADERTPSWEPPAGQPTAPVAAGAQAEETLASPRPPRSEDRPGAPQPPPRGKVFVKVLGPHEVEGWAVPPTRQKTTELLVYLALHRDRPVSTDRLRTALWPYQPGRPDFSIGTVHQELSRLRRCLGAEHFPESKGGAYQLGEGVETDWQHFQAFTEGAMALPEEKSGRQGRSPHVGPLPQPGALGRGRVGRAPGPLGRAGRPAGLGRRARRGGGEGRVVRPRPGVG